MTKGKIHRVDRFQMRITLEDSSIKTITTFNKYPARKIITFYLEDSACYTKVTETYSGRTLYVSPVVRDFNKVLRQHVIVCLCVRRGEKYDGVLKW